MTEISPDLNSSYNAQYIYILAIYIAMEVDLVILALNVLFDISLAMSDAQLGDLMTSFWNADLNKAAYSDVHYSLQGHADSNSDHDYARNKFFTYVNEAHLFTKPTFSTFISLLDNFHHFTGEAEHWTSGQNAEIDRFLHEIEQTRVMQILYDALHRDGLVTSKNDFQHKIYTMWFTKYSRHSSQAGSTGFEHVFVGETTSSNTTGLHNWIQFYLEEKKGNLNYQGYIYTKQPRIIGTHFLWFNKQKKLTSLLVGSSPEFEMAAYTACYFYRKNGSCVFEMSGYHMSIKTYDITYMVGDQIGTAYFD